MVVVAISFVQPQDFLYLQQTENLQLGSYRLRIHSAPSPHPSMRIVSISYCSSWLIGTCEYIFIAFYRSDQLHCKEKCGTKVIWIYQSLVDAQRIQSQNKENRKKLPHVVKRNRRPNYTRNIRHGENYSQFMNKYHVHEFHTHLCYLTTSDGSMSTYRVLNIDNIECASLRRMESKLAKMSGHARQWIIVWVARPRFELVLMCVCCVCVSVLSCWGCYPTTDTSELIYRYINIDIVM